jgi:hypothetical protein
MWLEGTARAFWNQHRIGVYDFKVRRGDGLLTKGPKGPVEASLASTSGRGSSPSHIAWSAGPNGVIGVATNQAGPVSEGPDRGALESHAPANSEVP